MPAKLQMPRTSGSIVMRARIFGAPKRVITPKGAQICPNFSLSCFAGGDIYLSCAQSKFEAKRLKIAPFMTDRTFWDPK